jgi:hypothetical protein
LQDRSFASFGDSGIAEFITKLHETNFFAASVSKAELSQCDRTTTAETKVEGKEMKAEGKEMKAEGKEMKAEGKEMKVEADPIVVKTEADSNAATTAEGNAMAVEAEATEGAAPSEEKKVVPIADRFAKISDYPEIEVCGGEESCLFAFYFCYCCFIIR